MLNDRLFLAVFFAVVLAMVAVPTVALWSLLRFAGVCP